MVAFAYTGSETKKEIRYQICVKTLYKCRKLRSLLTKSTHNNTINKIVFNNT